MNHPAPRPASAPTGGSRPARWAAIPVAASLLAGLLLAAAPSAPAAGDFLGAPLPGASRAADDPDPRTAAAWDLLDRGYRAAVAPLVEPL